MHMDDQLNYHVIRKILLNGEIKISIKWVGPEPLSIFSIIYFVQKIIQWSQTTNKYVVFPLIEWCVLS
jgi:sulfatase maturation enzyme AslB (radical SAM superfamily)